MQGGISLALALSRFLRLRLFYSIKEAFLIVRSYGVLGRGLFLTYR
jgi:hypothetical protein